MTLTKNNVQLLGVLGIIALALTLGLLALFGSVFPDDSSSDQNNSEVTDSGPIKTEAADPPQPLQLGAAVRMSMGEGATIQQLVKLNCDLFVTYSPEYFQRLSEEIPTALPNYEAITDARSAATFVETYALASSSFLEDYEKVYLEAIQAILKVSKTGIDTNVFEIDSSAWGSEIGSVALTECENLALYPVTLSLVQNLQSELNRVESLARSAPWYPDGYKIVNLDPNFAFQVTGGSCQLGNSCARFKILGKVACQSLYLEINFLNSANEVVDFGNELLTLPANQTAVIDIGTFSDVDSWQMVKLLCY